MGAGTSMSRAEVVLPLRGADGLTAPPGGTGPTADACTAARHGR